MGKTREREFSLGLKLSDILVTVVVAIVFGAVYKLWSPMYDLVKPLGLHAEETVYGMWFMAATFAFLLIRKPGVAVVAELAAASAETFFGSEWGVATLIYGLLQGLGAEIFFAAFRYRKPNLGVTVLAAIGAGVASLILDWFYGYIGYLSLWNFTVLVALRLLGCALIAGLFAYYLAKAVEATGVTSLLRPSSPQDYEALE
ncbi:MAG TPA: ECF transporter S component [Bacilli bacterium]